MSEYKSECTRGIVNVIHGVTEREDAPYTSVIVMTDFKSGMASTKESMSNAKLCAEAFDVLNETGLTPREILAQRDELLDRLKDAVCALECCGKDYPVMTKAHAAIARVTGESK